MQLLSKLPTFFYNKDGIKKRNVFAAMCGAALVIGGLIIRYDYKNNESSRKKWTKLYFETKVDTLKWMSAAIHIHLPLTINSLLIIKYLRIHKSENQKLNYHRVSDAVPFGFINLFITQLFIGTIIGDIFFKTNNISTMHIYKKYIQSEAQKYVTEQINAVNEMLNEALDEKLDNVPFLSAIIWSYIGSPKESVDMSEFKDLWDYITHDLGKKFIEEEKEMNSFQGRITYLTRRNVNIFWPEQANIIALKLAKNNIGFRNLYFPFIYFTIMFSKMFISQIWYIALLETTGNHDLLRQYLYCLMSREPLYLVLASPVWVLSFTRFKFITNITDDMKYFIISTLEVLSGKTFDKQYNHNSNH